MIRLVAFLLGILVIATGLHWLADRPGTITIEWLGYIAETSVFRALIILAAALAALLAAWSLLRQMWRTPAALARRLDRRRHRRGLDALTGGIIAVGAGDRGLALRYAAQARKALPHEPLTHLLRAQAAQIGGDRATARRIFEAMLASPDTEQLGLRGLFLEAEREGEREAARQFAERALRKNPKLSWPVEALFDLQCRGTDWQGALATLEIARRQSLIGKPAGNRRRAVLLTAQAQALEDHDSDKALELALEAHRLAPDLVPAAAIAGRLLAARGNTPRAARVLLKTWRLAPHPDLATAYAYARPGDSPRDRLVRVRHLGRLTPNHTEAQIAVAIGAIEARDWNEARDALAPLIEGRLTPRVCTLMARIEAEQHGDTGRAREWFARAMTATRDPAWTADGVASDRWSPVSPVTGELDAVRWRVPIEPVGEASAAALAAKMEALVGPVTARDARPAETERRKPPVADEVPVTIESRPAAEPAAPAKAPPPAQVAARADAPARVPSPEPAVPTTRAPPVSRPHVEVIEDVPASDVPEPERKPLPAPKRPQPVPRPATPQARVRKPVEPRIFVAPRAPDDPGTEALESDDFSPYPTKA